MRLLCWLALVLWALLPTMAVYEPMAHILALLTFPVVVFAAMKVTESFRVIKLRTIPDTQARVELIDYFVKNPDSYPSDAATALRLDAAEVRDLVADMCRDGILEEVRP